jgi:hypothetical protein
MNLNPVGWASSSLRSVAQLFNSGVNSTVPVTAISEAPVGVANADIALVAKGIGATLAQVPDGTLLGGNKRGAGATDWQKSRTSVSQVASGSFSTIGGGRDNTAGDFYCFIGGGQNNNTNNSYSVVCGGQNHNSGGSGLWSFVGGGLSNVAASNYSFVGGGQTNQATTNTHATVCGGNGNTASGQQSFVGGGNTNAATQAATVVCGGQDNTASSTYAFIGGGVGNIANGSRSFVSGGSYGTTRLIDGYHVFPACAAPIATLQGRTQSGLLLLARQTTDATATVLTSNTSAAGTTNQVILPNNSAYSFSGEVIAGVTGAGDTAAWNFKGAIKRGGTAASTAVVGTVVLDRIAYDTGATAWTVAVTADTTNGGIKVEVAGAAATTIRWVCKINTTEMTY